MQKRFDAVCRISDRHTVPAEAQGAKVLEYFAEDVFDIEKMAAHLPKSAYKKLMATINGMQPLDPSIADDVATAMKEWAVSRGATHYTHWFQPLTGGTAEKHDSFLEFSGGKAIFELNQGQHHDHFVCLVCGKVEEFCDPEIEHRQETVARERGFSIRSHALYLYGICASKECRRAADEEKTAAPLRAAKAQPGA